MPGPEMIVAGGFTVPVSCSIARNAIIERWSRAACVTNIVLLIAPDRYLSQVRYIDSRSMFMACVLPIVAAVSAELSPNFAPNDVLPSVEASPLALVASALKTSGAASAQSRQFNASPILVLDVVIVCRGTSPFFPSEEVPSAKSFVVTCEEDSLSGVLTGMNKTDRCFASTVMT